MNTAQSSPTDVGQIVRLQTAALAPYCVYGQREGGAGQPVRIQTPPPLSSRPPNVLEPGFLQFEILGQIVGAKGCGNFFLASSLFLLPCVSVLKILRIL